MTRAILLIPLVLFVGCDSKFEEREKIGVFVYIDHMGQDNLRWEGGNTYGRYTELCNTVSNECFYRGAKKGPKWARSLVSSYSLSGDKRHIAVRTNHRNKRPISAKELALFDLTTGIEIPCEGCTNRARFTNENQGFGWFYKENYIQYSVSVDDYITTWNYEKAVISTTSYKFEALTTFTESNSVDVSAVGINENGDLEARKCKGTCWLWTKNLETGEEKEYPNTCTGSFSLEWKDGVPVMHC